MKPEEKAQELIETFQKEIPDYLYQGRVLDQAAKACAIICVDEIIDSWEEDGNSRLDAPIIAYWQSVKEAIQKL